MGNRLRFGCGMDTISRVIVILLLSLGVQGYSLAYGLVNPTAPTSTHTGIQLCRANGLVCYPGLDSEEAACADGEARETLVAPYTLKRHFNPVAPNTLSSQTGVKTPGSGCMVQKCKDGFTSCVPYNGYQFGNGGGLGQIQVQDPPGCPANSSKLGANCVCDVGYKGGTFGGASASSSCVPYSCPSAGSSFSGTFESPTRAGADGFSCVGDGTYAGCVIERSFQAGTSNDGVTFTYFSSGKFSGAACQEGGTSNSSPTEPPAASAPPSEPTPQQKCALTSSSPMCLGTVNGTQVCVACGGTSVQKTEQATAPSGSASAPAGFTPGTTTTTTDCVGSNCTRTTTIKDSSGNTIGQTTTTGTAGDIGKGTSSNGSGGGGGDLDGLCAQYPTIPACKSGSFSGSCSAGAASMTCDGDGIQCSIAREQFKRNCELFEKSSPQSDKGIEAVGAGDTPGDHPHSASKISSTSVSFSSSISQDALIASSCPADVSVPMGSFQPLVLSFSAICDPAVILGNVGVAFAWIFCLFIVFKRD